MCFPLSVSCRGQDLRRFSLASFTEEFYYALTAIANNPTRDETRDIHQPDDRNLFAPATVLAFTWQFTQVILIAMYTANLASALIKPTSTAITDRSQLLGQPVITYTDNE